MPLKSCKILQYPELRNLSVLLLRKEYVPVVGAGSKRCLSNRHRTRFVSSAAAHKLIHEMKKFNSPFEELARRKKSIFSNKPIKNDLRRWMVISSIQLRIIEMEAIITDDSVLPVPETPLQLVRKFNRKMDSFFYIEEKWLQIVNEKDTPRVRWLIALLKAGDLQRDLFCTAMGEFFFLRPPVVNSEIPPITEFEPQEIRRALLCKPMFGVECDVNFGLDCVQHVLMKTP